MLGRAAGWVKTTRKYWRAAVRGPSLPPGRAYAAASPLDAIAGIWYRYNDDGSPVWLWVDATSSGGSSFYAGTVTRYDVTNVGAPAWSIALPSLPMNFARVESPFMSAIEPAAAATYGCLRIFASTEAETVALPLDE